MRDTTGSDQWPVEEAPVFHDPADPIFDPAWPTLDPRAVEWLRSPTIENEPAALLADLRGGSPIDRAGADAVEARFLVLTQGGRRARGALDRLGQAADLHPYLQWQQHNLLGVLADDDGDYDAAIAHFRQAWELATPWPNPRERRISGLNSLIAAMWQGDGPLARRFLVELAQSGYHVPSLDVVIGGNLLFAGPVSVTTIGELLQAAGFYHGGYSLDPWINGVATESVDETPPLELSIPEYDYRSRIQSEIVQAERLLAEAPTASQAAARRALSLAREVDSRLNIRIARIAIARAHLALGAPQAALDEFEQLDVTRTPLEVAAGYHFDRATAEWQVGRRAEALASHEACRQLHRRSRDMRSTVLDAYRELLEMYRDAATAATHAQLNAEVVAATRAMQEVTAKTAHDLRSSLSVLRLGFSDGLDPASRSMVGEAVDRMSQAASQVQWAARLDELADSSPSNESDLAAVVAEVVSTYAPMARRQKQALHFNAPTEPVPVLGRATLIAQVITNLVENALRFTPESGSIWITISAEHADPGTDRAAEAPAGDTPRFAAVAVADNGVGVQPGQAESIFQRFVRDAEPVHGASSSGLGLHIVATTVERLGGSATCRPREGGGTEFEVVLPQAGSSATSSSASS